MSQNKFSWKYIVSNNRTSRTSISVPKLPSLSSFSVFKQTIRTRDTIFPAPVHGPRCECCLHQQNCIIPFKTFLRSHQKFREQQKSIEFNEQLSKSGRKSSNLQFLNQSTKIDQEGSSDRLTQINVLQHLSPIRPGKKVEKSIKKQEKTLKKAPFPFLKNNSLKEKELKEKILKQKRELEGLQNSVKLLYDKVCNIMSGYTKPVNLRQIKQKPLAQADEDQQNEQAVPQDSQQSFEVINDLDNFLTNEFVQVNNLFSSVDQQMSQKEIYEQKQLLLKILDKLINIFKDQTLYLIKEKFKFYRGVDVNQQQVKSYFRILKRIIRQHMSQEYSHLKFNSEIFQTLLQIDRKNTEIVKKRLQLYKQICSLQKITGKGLDQLEFESMDNPNSNSSPNQNQTISPTDPDPSSLRMNTFHSSEDQDKSKKKFTTTQKVVQRRKQRKLTERRQREKTILIERSRQKQKSNSNSYSSKKKSQIQLEDRTTIKSIVSKKSSSKEKKVEDKKKKKQKHKHQKVDEVIKQQPQSPIKQEKESKRFDFYQVKFKRNNQFKLLFNQIVDSLKLDINFDLGSDQYNIVNFRKMFQRLFDAARKAGKDIEEEQKIFNTHVALIQQQRQIQKQQLQKQLEDLQGACQQKLPFTNLKEFIFQIRPLYPKSIIFSEAELYKAYIFIEYFQKMPFRESTPFRKERLQAFQEQMIKRKMNQYS